MPKIAFIWPCFPWRWWIAHHTNQMINAYLNNWDRVWVFTFSRQYPRFLYPGKAQIEPDWTQNPLPKSNNFILKKSIDTLNPISWYMTAASIIKQKPKYCLIKYWHPYFVPCFTFIAWLLRRRKIPIVCIVDNLYPHERHRGDSLLTRIFFSQVSCAITQSEIVHKEFLTSFPYIPETIIAHPAYNEFWPKIWKIEARKKLNIPQNKKILLFFGFIRPYKGLEMLLSIMPKLITKYPNIHLLIAGECFGSFEPYDRLIHELHLSKYLTLHLSYTKNSEIPTYFGACDLLVMPYRTITNSGIENIGKVYAKKSLLMVGATPNELFHGIVSALNWNINVLKPIWWDEYCYQLEKFLFKYIN